MIRDLIEVSLTTSIIIAVLLVSMPLVSKRYSSKCRYWIWLFVAIRLVIPVNFSSSKAPVAIPVLIQSPGIEASKITSQPAPIIISKAETVSQMDHSGLIWDNLLVILWLTGILLFLLWHISSHFIFCKGLKRFGKSADEQTIKIFYDIKSMLNVKRNVRILTCKRISSPMMLGFFKPCVVIPDKEFENQELEVIITHELVHFKRHDLLYKLLILIARAVHWFNPLVHVMSVAANRDIEISCDAEVIKDSCSDFRKLYAETVLKVVRNSVKPKTTLSTYFYGGKKSVKKRFSSIFDLKTKKKGFMLITLVLISTLTAGMLISCGKVPEQKETPTTVNASSNKDLTPSAINSKTVGSPDVKKSTKPVISSTEKVLNTTSQVKGKRYDGESRLASTSDWFSFKDLTPAEKIKYNITLPEAWKNDNTVFSINGKKVAEIVPAVKLKNGQKLPDKFIPSGEDIYGEMIKTADIKIKDMNGKLRVYKQIPDDNPKPWYTYTYFLQRADKVFVIMFYTFDNNSSDAVLYEQILSTLYFE